MEGEPLGEQREDDRALHQCQHATNTRVFPEAEGQIAFAWCLTGDRLACTTLCGGSRNAELHKQWKIGKKQLLHRILP
jgi:hypothetical protein